MLLWHQPQGPALASDFRTLVGHIADKSLDKRKDKANVAACFIGLLLLANEKNLELRTPDVDGPKYSSTASASASSRASAGAGAGAGTAGGCVGDKGYDLTNFRIFAPVGDVPPTAAV